MIPAYMLGLRMNLPVMDLESFLGGQVISGGKRSEVMARNPIRRVLLVDDSIQFGGQLEKVMSRLVDKTQYEFTTFVIYASESGREKVDYFAECLPSPRIFQWNLLNSWIYEFSCVDIDGVLCEDPTEEQNDDGEEYLDFLENAVPKYLPPCKVDVLVTSRLEKYRPQTERWLAKVGVSFNKLEMLNLPDKATRVRLGVHATFKSDIYRANANAMLFIESNAFQALKINEISGKPVFCVENMTYIGDKDASGSMMINTLRKKWRKLKKVL